MAYDSIRQKGIWRSWKQQCNRDPRVPTMCFSVPCQKYPRRYVNACPQELWCRLSPCRSECAISCMPKCQIPLRFPPPNPPLRLVRDLGPMQGPGGRAPFAPPPFVPCCGPPTPIGAVIGPCPRHGDVASTPELIPFMEMPMLIHNPCPCRSVMNCATFQF